MLGVCVWARVGVGVGGCLCVGEGVCGWVWCVEEISEEGVQIVEVMDVKVWLAVVTCRYVCFMLS